MYDGDEETYLNLEVTDTLDLKDNLDAAQDVRCWSIKDVSRDTYQDRLANFTTDTNRTPSINIYLINKIKVTSFYNPIRRVNGRFEQL